MKIKRIISVKDLSFENLPVCVAEFIKQVIKKMRYRKKVRADVAAELIAHFEDELKECSNDEEKEQKAQRLIAEFGDIKLLAVLLRRAKKRCRPLWRTLVARGFQTAGLLVLCLIIYIAWFLTGKPAITTNYLEQLNRMVRPTADESLNAAPLYEKAIELYEASSQTVDKLMWKKYNEAAPEEKQLMETWLADNKNILDLVIAGSKKPYYWEEYGNGAYNYEMMSIPLPNPTNFHRLAFPLSRWRVWIRAEENRYEDAFDDIKACYRLGQHLKANKTNVEQMLGIVIENLAIQTLHGIVSEHKIDSAILAVLQKDFEQMIADEDFVISFDAEKLFLFDGIQRCFTEGRFGDGHLYLGGLEPIMLRGPDRRFVNRLIVPLHILFTHPDKQQTREMADRLYAFSDRMVRKTPGQLHSEAIDVEKETDEIVRGNILLKTLPSSINMLHDRSYRNKTDVEAALTIIAILRYNQDTGDYPENLDQLIAAGYLKKLPMDCYSDNKPLLYKKTESNFTLYSIGRNFKDDGGMVEMWVIDEGDWVFWPVTK